MKKHTKTEQLQIRLTAKEKEQIRRSAEAENQTISEWILNQLQRSQQRSFETLVEKLETESSYAFSDLNEFIESIAAKELSALAMPTALGRLQTNTQNYLAAMIEHAAHQKNTPPPRWTQTINPPTQPQFGSELKSLRLHLLLHSPAAFRRRNIFIDSSIGDKV